MCTLLWFVTYINLFTGVTHANKVKPNLFGFVKFFAPKFNAIFIFPKYMEMGYFDTEM